MLNGSSQSAAERWFKTPAPQQDHRPRTTAYSALKIKTHLFASRKICNGRLWSTIKTSRQQTGRIIPGTLTGAIATLDSISSTARNTSPKKLLGTAESFTHWCWKFFPTQLEYGNNCRMLMRRWETNGRPHNKRLFALLSIPRYSWTVQSVCSRFFPY